MLCSGFVKKAYIVRVGYIKLAFPAGFRIVVICFRCVCAFVNVCQLLLLLCVCVCVCGVLLHSKAGFSFSISKVIARARFRIAEPIDLDVPCDFTFCMLSVLALSSPEDLSSNQHRISTTNNIHKAEWNRVTKYVVFHYSFHHAYIQMCSA